MRFNAILKQVLMLCLFVATRDVAALAEDRDKPLEIEADTAELDDALKVAVYKGNVLATQGSMKLSGDLLTVRYTESKDIKEVLVDGKPAKFSQKPDQGTKNDEGEANRIEYHALDKLVYLINNAKVTQQDQVYTGQRMAYDTERSIVTMKGGPADAVTNRGSTPSKPGRVKIVIPPKAKPAN